jgi:hypothetical protein
MQPKLHNYLCFGTVLPNIGKQLPIVFLLIVSIL